jgi:hypothetical protein
MVTMRAIRKGMHLGLVILWGRRSPNAWMALFPSRPLLSGFPRRLLIRGPHPRGGGGVRMGTRSLKRFLEGFKLLVHFKELADRRFLTRPVERDGFFFS